MAWQRSALGVGAVSAFLLHEPGGSLPAAAPGLFGLGVAALLLVLTEVRYEHTVRRVGAGAAVSSRMTSRMILLLSGTVFGLAVAAVALILVAAAS